MTVLVIGGTGKVGSVLVRRLCDAGVEVRVLVRSAARVHLVPSGAVAVAGAIVEDPDGARAAFEGIDQVYMLNQPTAGEVVEGVLAVALARSAGVRRFIYQSVFEVERHAHLPHVASKLAIAAALKGSGMEWTTLSPNHFFQNDWMTRDALLQGSRYTLPVGLVGCSSVDARDIAEAAEKVLTSAGHAHRDYPIVGAETLTGPACAAAWSKALGRDIVYEASPQSWRLQMGALMPKWLSFDLSQMYETFGRQGFNASERDVAMTTELLGRSPRRYEDFVSHTLSQWLSASTA